jgi:hypothetical protein
MDALTEKLNKILVNNDSLNEALEKIAAIIAKRDEIIAAQEELMKIYKLQSAYLGDFGESGLLEKITALKKEI